MPIVYHEAARDELLREIAYLEGCSTGLGRRFFGEVQRAERLIVAFPESGTEIVPGIRKTVLRVFPYSLLYTIESERFFILAVAHHRRRPGYWSSRAGPGE
jgi:plasmid stabilization system protein ParE